MKTLSAMIGMIAIGFLIAMGIRLSDFVLPQDKLNGGTFECYRIEQPTTEDY